MIKATLVLEGGATRGVFTAGVLDYLMEQDIYFSHVLGVSAGACNGVDYVSKQPGRTRDCMIPTDKSGGYYHGVRTFLKEKSYMNMDLIFDKFPKEVYPFDFETYFNSEIVNEYVTTNCITGKAEYMTEDSDPERLLKVIRASCSMPLLSPIVNIDGTPYLDGGLSDAVPLERALEMGNEKIIVVLTKNKGYRKQYASSAMRRLYRRSYRSFPNLIHSILLRPIAYNRTMGQIEKLEKEGKIFVLRPRVKLISRLERNAGQLQMFYDHGYRLMERERARLERYLNAEREIGVFPKS
ncbi:MAG: patatin family protein [Lachnospiraceae bacterium]|nr:patatin family protein [Lachnospiraceae bacterium]